MAKPGAPIDPRGDLQSGQRPSLTLEVCSHARWQPSGRQLPVTRDGARTTAGRSVGSSRQPRARGGARHGTARVLPERSGMRSVQNEGRSGCEARRITEATCGSATLASNDSRMGPGQFGKRPLMGLLEPTNLTAYATVAMALIAIPSLLVSLYLTWTTLRALRIQAAATYPSFLVTTLARAGETLAVRLRHVAGTVPAESVEIWVQTRHQVYGPGRMPHLSTNQELDRTLARASRLPWHLRLQRPAKPAETSARAHLGWRLASGAHAQRWFQVELK